jgi:uncharacterized protein YciI
MPTHQKTFLVILSGRSGKLDEPPPPEVERAHYHHLLRLQDEGTLRSSGLFATLDRGFQILRTDTRDRADSIVKSDPLLRHNYYTRYEIDYYTRYEIDELLSPNPEDRPHDYLRGHHPR